MASPSDTRAHQCPAPSPGPSPGPGPGPVTGTNSESNLVDNNTESNLGSEISEDCRRCVTDLCKKSKCGPSSSNSYRDHEIGKSHSQLQAQYHTTLGECMGTSPPSEQSKYHGGCGY